MLIPAAGEVAACREKHTRCLVSYETKPIQLPVIFALIISTQVNFQEFASVDAQLLRFEKGIAFMRSAKMLKYSKKSRCWRIATGTKIFHIC